MGGWLIQELTRQVFSGGKVVDAAWDVPKVEEPCDERKTIEDNRIWWEKQSFPCSLTIEFEDAPTREQVESWNAKMHSQLNSRLEKLPWVMPELMATSFRKTVRDVQMFTRHARES